MLTVTHLRQRILDSGAAADIAHALGFTQADLSDVPDREVLTAFAQLSCDRPDLRARLHRHAFPDFEALGRYTGDTPLYHLEGGFGTAHEISRLADKHGVPIESASAVLDFGCGTSRVLRFLAEFLPGPRYYGTEVFREVIDWGRATFPEITYLHHGPRPPLPLDSTRFDVAYAYSIFSHLDEPVHLAWLGELRRAMRPGGLLIVTIQSDAARRRLREREFAQRLGVSRPAELCKQFDTKGFGFEACYDQKSLSDGGLDPQSFGITLIARSYIETKWAGFDLLEHLPGAISDFQDWVVLRAV